MIKDNNETPGSKNCNPLFRQKIIREINLPIWLPKFIANYSNEINSVEDKISLTIALAEENVRQETGGPFGALIFNEKTNQIISFGVNLVTSECHSSLHAEMVAISIAEESGKDFNPQDCILYSSCEPCAMCACGFLWANLKGLIFGAPSAEAIKIGFDEGDKTSDWKERLEKRNIFVRGNLLPQIYRNPFNLYVLKNGKIY